MSDKECKVFQVMNADGVIIRLVEATTAKEVKEHILRSADVYEIRAASALTVARAGLEVEKAK